MGALRMSQGFCTFVFSFKPESMRKFTNRKGFSYYTYEGCLKSAEWIMDCNAEVQR